MLKLLVVSDTHGDQASLLALINRESPLDGLIHLGDHYKDAENLPIAVYGVRGNTDLGQKAPLVRSLVFHQIKLFLTHGHEQGVSYDLQRLYYMGCEAEADIILFGHTHIPYLEQVAGRYLMNPGSLSKPRSDQGRTYGIIEISTNSPPRLEIKNYFSKKC